MTAQNARLLVLAAGIILAATVVLKGGGVTGRYRSLWAVGLLVLVGSAVADLAPNLIGPFALLVIVAWYARKRHGGTLTTTTVPAPGP